MHFSQLTILSSKISKQKLIIKYSLPAYGIKINFVFLSNKLGKKIYLEYVCNFLINREMESQVVKVLAFKSSQFDTYTRSILL